MLILLIQDAVPIEGNNKGEEQKEDNELTPLRTMMDMDMGDDNLASFRNASTIFYSRDVLLTLPINNQYF